MDSAGKIIELAVKNGTNSVMNFEITLHRSGPRKEAEIDSSRKAAPPLCRPGALTRRNLFRCVLALALANLALAADPQPKREGIEWCDVWITHGTEHELPRVLLIGDSITRAYYKEVEQKLQGTAYVGRLATSKCLADPVLFDEISTVLKQYKFDLIHFNNGMHGWDYTEEEYARAFPQFLKSIKQGAPGAKLIWASTTPVREKKELVIAPKTERVKARNRIAAEIMAKEKIPVDDLFALMIEHPEYSNADGVHFSPKGVSAQAAQVAGIIESELKAMPKK